MQTLGPVCLYLQVFSCVLFNAASGLDKWAELMAVGRGGATGRKSLPPPPLYTDCRFWTDPHQHFELLRMKQQRPRGVSQVFFYWDNSQQVCLPCTRCQSMGKRTLVPCDFFTDTKCVSQEEWARQDAKHPYWGKGGNDYYDDEDEDDEHEEAVVVHEADGPVKRGEKVFGEAKFASHGKPKDDSATRQVIRHKVNETLRRYGKRLPAAGGGPDGGSPYGLPSFYASDPKEKKNSVVNYEDQPIDDVVREFLNNNITGKVSVKDIFMPKGRGFRIVKTTTVRTAGASSGSTRYRPPRQRKKPAGRYYDRGSSGLTTPYSTTFQRPATQTPLVWSTRRYYQERTSLSTSTETSTEATTASTETPNEAPAGDFDTELVRPDIFNPSKDGFHRNTRTYGEGGSQTAGQGRRPSYDDPHYEDPAHGDQEFGVEHDNLDDKERKQDPGDLAFSQIVHDLLEDVDETVENSLHGGVGPSKKSSQKTPMLLEQILITVSLLVLVLLLLLVIVLVRNKYKASRFKLLDNADGVDSYQSLSPFRRSESATSRLITSPGQAPSSLELGQAAPVHSAQKAAVPDAVARSLKNINPARNGAAAGEEMEGGGRAAAVYVDERGRTKLK